MSNNIGLFSFPFIKNKDAAFCIFPQKYVFWKFRTEVDIKFYVQNDCESQTNGDIKVEHSPTENGRDVHNGNRYVSTETSEDMIEAQRKSCRNKNFELFKNFSKFSRNFQFFKKFSVFQEIFKIFSFQEIFKFFSFSRNLQIFQFLRNLLSIFQGICKNFKKISNSTVFQEICQQIFQFFSFQEIFQFFSFSRNFSVFPEIFTIFSFSRKFYSFSIKKIQRILYPNYVFSTRLK